MKIVKTANGVFALVKYGEVHYRDKKGNFTGRITEMYKEVPLSEYDQEADLSFGEKKVAEDAAKNIFAPAFRASDKFKNYIEECKAAGVDFGFDV